MTRSSTTATPGLSGSPEPAGWVSCPACGWPLYRKRLDRNLHVCPECDHHLRLSARARIDMPVDGSSFTETTFPPGGATPTTADPPGRAPSALSPRVRHRSPAGGGGPARRSGESEAVVVGVAR